MDYKTKPTSRKDLRLYASYFRQIFAVPLTGEFPVLLALEKIGQVFKGSYYEVVEDEELPPQTMARCMPLPEGGFKIEIKESVYVGAYENRKGAFLGFICHEICHVFLYTIGFTPILERAFNQNELPAYCSVEWQTMALCAEVMIPFEESKGMTAEEIQKKYLVSKAFAEKREKMDER